MDRVEVQWVCSPAAGVAPQRVVLSLPQGATARDALHAAGHAALPHGWALALWGRKVGPLEPLRDGDQLALLRPLVADPMEARRRRQQVHQAKRSARA